MLDVSEAHIAELKRQNALLLEQVRQLSAIVRQVPTLLTRARMDQAQGKQTVYDYRVAQRALAIRV